MNTQNYITGALPVNIRTGGTANNAFIDFVFRQKRNRTLLFTLLACATLEFIIFKICYPFPDFFSDSWSYIFAAREGLDVNIWPIGYSKFLAVFHWITYSHLALITFQYFCLVTSSLYFYYTVTYFYTTRKYTRIILILFLFFNPLQFYIANYVTSDAIFISLSLVWVSQLMWIMHKPQLYQVFFQAVLFFIAFTFRYNALFYPVITAIAFLFSRQATWRKVLGIVIGPLLIIPFIFYCLSASEKMTGTAQFPPILGGWQWGNNALYMYEHINADSTKMTSPEVRELNRIAIQFFKETPPHERNLPAYVANYFIRQPNAPLKQYMFRHYQPKTGYDDVAAWGKVSPVFKEFGLSLVKRHPVAFARYYMGVNTMNYFFPPLEKLEVYNLGFDKTVPIVQKWFHLDSLDLPVALPKRFQGILLFLYPTLFCILNLCIFIGYFHFVQPKYSRNADPRFRQCAVLIGVFVLLNLCFSIFANIIVIRYQVFPMFICLTFTLLLIDELRYFENKEKRNVQ